MLRSLSSGLLLAILALLGIGLVQVYSASYIFAIESYGDGLFFFKRQVVFALVAFFVMLMMVRIPFEFIRKWGWSLWAIGFLLVLATFVPGVGIRVGGALRWINLPFGIRFEPAELLKISMPMLFASILDRENNFLGKLKWQYLVVFVAAPLVLLLKQPDFGSFAIIVMVGLGLLFAFGLRWKYILSGIALIIPAFYFLVMSVPYRRARVLAFLDPWSDPEQKGFQVIQSMLTFHSGGLTGVGLGQGQGKLFFLPEAHTDFTMAVLGEEMGFIGLIAVLAIYGFIVIRTLQIAMKSDSQFKKAFSLGTGLVFALSIFINIGVVIGLLPTKGLTLPFLSYGGSSLVSLCFIFGLVLNVENNIGEFEIGKK